MYILYRYTDILIHEYDVYRYVYTPVSKAIEYFLFILNKIRQKSTHMFFFVLIM